MFCGSAVGETQPETERERTGEGETRILWRASEESVICGKSATKTGAREFPRVLNTERGKNASVS